MRNYDKRLPKGARTTGGVRTCNAREFYVAEALEQEGFEVFKKGWPDLLAYRTGEIRLVEVKPPLKSTGLPQEMKVSQRRVAEILYEVVGLEVGVVRSPGDLYLLSK